MLYDVSQLQYDLKSSAWDIPSNRLPQRGKSEREKKKRGFDDEEESYKLDKEVDCVEVTTPEPEVRSWRAVTLGGEVNTTELGDNDNNFSIAHRQLIASIVNRTIHRLSPKQQSQITKMAPKRDRDDDAQGPKVKRVKGGFKVGPENLPDGTWRRKVIKIKKDLIHKAKVKKSYAKVKKTAPLLEKPHVPEPEPSTIIIRAPEEPVRAPSPKPSTETAQDAAVELHPSRQAMLDEPEVEEKPLPPRNSGPKLPRAERKPRTKKPGYFEKEKAIADQKKKEAEERRAEFERREAEKKAKLAERERFRRAMAKARTGGKNGQRKLGRESGVLLEKVRRMVG